MNVKFLAIFKHQANIPPIIPNIIPNKINLKIVSLSKFIFEFSKKVNFLRPNKAEMPLAVNRGC